MSNVTYEYEVAYSVDPECSGDHVSLPDGYTLYYPRTSTHYIEVVGLMSGICYVFGVRAYTSVTYSPGKFSLIQGYIISEGSYNSFFISFLINFIIASCIVTADISELSASPLYTSFQLTWTASSNSMYEVAYAVHPQGSIECTATDTTTFTEVYTSYLNTTDSSVNVTCLELSTCYIFGIRVVTVEIVGEVGEWTLLVNNSTLGLGMKLNDHCFVKCFIQICVVLDDQQCSSIETTGTQSSTGLVAGSVTLSVIIVILTVLLMVQSIVIVYIKKFVNVI